LKVQTAEAKVAPRVESTAEKTEEETVAPKVGSRAAMKAA
jgi:hypothetical protein